MEESKRVGVVMREKGDDGGWRGGGGDVLLFQI
jgi:hypothetical protein